VKSVDVSVIVTALVASVWIAQTVGANTVKRKRINAWR